MVGCEKCWEDAGDDYARYCELREERIDSPCTPEEQAGRDAGLCPKCKRWAVHQYSGVCMFCRMVEG